MRLFWGWIRVLDESLREFTRVYERLEGKLGWGSIGVFSKEGDLLTAYLSEQRKSVRRPVPQQDPPLDGVARDGSI